MDGKLEKNRSVLIWISGVVGSRKLGIGFLLILQIILSIGSLSYALIFKGLIDAAVGGRKQRFFMWVIIFAGTALFLVLMNAVYRWVSEYTRASVENRLKERLLSFILNRDYGEVTAVHSGEWMNRLTSDTTIVADGVTQILPGVTGMLVRMIGAVVLLIYMYPLFGCLVIPCGILLIIMNALFRKVLKKRHKEVQEADGNLRIFLQENLGSLLVVKAFSREKQTVDGADTRMEEHKRLRMKRNHFSNICNVGFGGAMNGAYVLGAAFGGYGILTGTMSYGTLMAMIQLIGQIQAPLAGLTGYFPQYYAMTASAERLWEIESFQPDESVQNAKTPEEIQNFYFRDFQSIVFEKADFDYRPLYSLEHDENHYQNRGVLRQLNLEIGRGDYVALTGPSGCGKSTLLKLMLCLYHLDGGRRFMKTAQGEIPLTAQWRSLFAYVPQGNHLMSGTIRQIVAFGDTEAMQDEEKIWRALQVADADDFVRKMPKGVDTLLGERGTGLSEGQMQRIAIARAIFSDHPILMLDESTSALDEQTEKNVLQNLRNMTEKTVIIVTHRKAVLSICDTEIRFSANGTEVIRRQMPESAKDKTDGKNENSIEN